MLARVGVKRFSDCQVPLCKFRSPIQDFLATVLVFKPHYLFKQLFSCVRFLSVWKSKHANREPNSYKHVGAFYLTRFSRVCEFFFSNGKGFATCYSRCALKFLCRHTYYRCSVFVFCFLLHR